MRPTMWTTLVTTVFLVAAQAAPWSRELPFGPDSVWTGDAKLEVLPDGGPGGGPVVAWTISASKGQELSLDLEAAGIDLADYDELHVDLFLEGSDCMPIVTARNWPRPGTVSNWYAKIPRPLGTWINWRCDLRLDDDGAFLHPKDLPEGQHLVFKLAPRFRRVPGEPDWRRVRIANLRLVRRPVSVTIDKSRIHCRRTADELITDYVVTVTATAADTAVLELDRTRTHFFQAAFPAATGDGGKLTLDLEAGETREVTVRLVMALRTAETLPALYSEPVEVSARLEGLPGITIRPLMGYRPWRLWGTVPPLNFRLPRPAETIARYRELTRIYPAAEQIVVGAVQRGEVLLNRKFDVLTDGPSRHGQGYICPDCQVRPRALSPTRHECPKCGKVLTSEKINKAYLVVHHGENAKALGQLADAYQHSGDERFAAKARDLFLLYAERYDKITHLEPRSTASQSRLVTTTLAEAFIMNEVFYHYLKLKASPTFSDADRRRIEQEFLLNSGIRMMAHGAEMNQRAEYFTCYGGAGLAGEIWPLAGEAVYSDQGFLSLLDDGFSADGIALEGGAYHAQTLQAMARFALHFEDVGVNVWNSRFKRLFDGTVAGSASGVAWCAQPYYEPAYRHYRDPLYLPTLQRVRRRPGPLTVAEGAIGLPEGPDMLGTSTNLAGSGYLYLRQLAPSGHRCLAINYGMQWDRSELDRGHFILDAGGDRVSGKVGRITYGSAFSGNMYRSFAHNLVTVDHQDLTEERLELAHFSEDGSLAVALLRTRPEARLYQGVSQQRLVAIVNGAFFVADVLSGDRPHRYDWHFYPAAPAQNVDLDLAAVDKPPVLWTGDLTEGTLGSCREGRTNDAVQAQWPAVEGKTPALALTLVADGPVTVLDGKMMQGYYPKQHPFLRVTRAETPNARFAALFAPAGTPEVAIEAASDDQAVAWRLRVGNVTVRLGVDRRTGDLVRGD